MTLPIVLLHGSHGKGFVHKAVVAALLLVSDLVVLASCGEAALAPGLSDMTVIVVGSAAAHVIELSLRHGYAEQVQERLRVVSDEAEQAATAAAVATAREWQARAGARELAPPPSASPGAAESASLAWANLVPPPVNSSRLLSCTTNEKHDSSQCDPRDV